MSLGILIFVLLTSTGNLALGYFIGRRFFFPANAALQKPENASSG